MLLWLSQLLQEYVRAFGVVEYLTFRGILGVLTALGMSLLLGPRMIARLQSLQIGQSGCRLAGSISGRRGAALARLFSSM